MQSNDRMPFSRNAGRVSRTLRSSVSLLALSLMLALSACSGTQPTEAPSPTATPTQAAKATPTPEASATAEASPSAKPAAKDDKKEDKGPTLVKTTKAADDDKDPEGPFVVYSGRNEKLVGPFLDKLQEVVGRDIEVHYASTSATAAKIVEEGDASPADLFFSQDAGALGLMRNKGMLANLGDLTANINPTLVDPDNQWVATSVRARVVVYNEKAKEAGEFKSVDEVLNDKYKGRIGYAPTNASFQSFVTALRVEKGEEAAKKWLEDFKALDPKVYPKNTAVLQAVDAGEVDLGLINHYYWYRMLAEKGADKMNTKLQYFSPKDPGGLLNIAGVGILKTAKHPTAAKKAVEYFLSKEGQAYFANKTAEYSVLPDVKADKFDLHPIDLKENGVDLNQLESLEATQKLLAEVGMI